MYIDTDAANAAAKKPRITVESSPEYREEATPLLETFVGQDAPPSYLEATTPMWWRGEGVGLLNEGPAVMTPLQEDGHKDGRYRRRSFKEFFSRKRVRWSAAIVAVIILVVIIAALASKRDKSTLITPTPAQPAQSGLPLPSRPAKGKESFPIRWPAACGKKNYNLKSEEMIFGKPSQLNIVEAVHQVDGPYKRVSGWIHVTRAPPEQAAGTIEAKLSYAISKTVDAASVKYSYTSTGLTIGDPSYPDGFDGIRQGDACLGISVVLYMAPGAKLENFNVRSTHLGMQIHNGVNFEVTSVTSITLTTGTLDATSFASRETRLETISGSISGKYALFDLLSVVTKTGSVNINVDPQEKAENGSAAALLYANTMSGSIRVDTERKNIPERDYVVNINSTAGSIDGTFIHGSDTKMTSVAGAINIDVLPYASGESSTNLRTKTTDGESNIKIRAPYSAPGKALTNLVSSHTSISGQIKLNYPQEWEGHLEGESVSGMLHLEGKDLELIRQDERPGMNLAEAKKGNGKSEMVFKTLNGACDVLVGRK
ncbi:hypothetical protein BU23DRAFT_447892 [Bimuria novae-zelandiae CBS 107.79]|uniref:Adhesin domain-containing protein n=1 Tax=Bimuria novae-zelandiae CBS 107.79 TaxID=1447943 RepID=A0A6A5VQ99_9PLEO|nr:hypothetical protein BU23DRAFT_447892 [Bimuria novae-zelandiae CBS 107.79]